MTVFYTIGHSTRSIEDFVSLLRAHGIDRLVDVRRYPGSRRFPHFGRDALAAHLEEAGIEYVHEPALGGRRKPDEPSRNTWWRNAQFRAYADYLATPEFEGALRTLIGRADEKPTAMMCAEAVHWRCHRQLVADVLVSRGHEVRHIASESKAIAHELNEHAREEDGHLVYPADDQLDLL